MPGLFAAVDLAARPDLATRFARMHQAGMPKPFPACERWLGEHVALGRVDLGIHDAGPQPVVAADGRFRVVFCGELRDAAERRAALAAKGVSVTGHADLLLAVYREAGLDGVARLNGSYFFALWDEEERTLVAGGDRYGSRPHFYSVLDGRLFLAPDMKAILAARGERPSPDERGLAEFMALEYPLADRSLFAGVHVFPAGTWLLWREDGAQWVPYWRPRYQPVERSDEALLDAAVPLYRQAVARCLVGETGVSLSGGTDSRLLLAMTDRRDMPTCTFGNPASEDVRLAAAVAATLGLEHQVVPLSPDFMACNVETIMTWGEGMVSLFHGHNGDRLEAKRAIAPIMLKGMTAEFCRLDAVEAILAEPARSPGHQLWLHAHHALTGRKKLSAFDSEEALVDRVVDHVWTALRPSEARMLLTEEFYQAMAHWVRQGVAEALAPIAAESLSDRLAAFNVGERQRRFSPWGLRTSASVLEHRKPLDDYDLVDFLMTVPPAQRRKLQEAVICREAPQLAAIGRTGSGTAIDAGYVRRAAAYAQKLLEARLGGGRVQSFANPQENIRTHARGFFEGLLLDAETLGNGYFRPEGVRSLVESHMAGRANAGSALGMLATVELWRRRYLQEAGVWSAA